jgi:toxin ParE1/3/4
VANSGAQESARRARPCSNLADRRADDVQTANEFLDEIERVFDVLAQSPLMGRARPELAARLRSFPSGSYVLFSVPLSDGVYVIRVLHGRQDVSLDYFK